MSEGKLESMLLEAMEVYRSIREEVKDELTGAGHVRDTTIQFHISGEKDMLAGEIKFRIRLSINGNVIEAPSVAVYGYSLGKSRSDLYRAIEDSIMDILDKELRDTLRKEFESSTDLRRMMSAPPPIGGSL